MGIKETYQNVRAILQAHIEARLGAVIMGVIGTIFLAAWAGAATYGKSIGQSLVIDWMKPITDSIKTRQNGIEATVTAIEDSIKSVKQEQGEARAMNEIVIAAQRQADPRFDQALQEMARAGEMARAKEKENRELMERLKKKSKNQ